MDLNIEKFGDCYTVPCVLPGLSCCAHRLALPDRPADNVWRCEVRCKKWRQNRMKDKVFHHCSEHYHIKGDAE